MRVKISDKGGNYWGDVDSKFWLWKGEVKELPENLTQSLEQALNDGILIETKEEIKTESTKKAMTDDVGGKRLKEDG
jgi:hypothetical protein